MCLFHLSDTKAIADLSLAKTLRAGHTEGLMLSKPFGDPAIAEGLFVAPHTHRGLFKEAERKQSERITRCHSGGAMVY